MSEFSEPRGRRERARVAGVKHTIGFLAGHDNVVVFPAHSEDDPTQLPPDYPDHPEPAA